MSKSEMRAIHRLATTDLVEIVGDVRVFRVTHVERSSPDPGARCKVHLRSMDGRANVMLVRAGHDLVRCVGASV
jgi:hypothetical protein